MDRLSGETATQLKKIAEIFNCDLDNPEQLKELYVRLQGWAQAERDGRLVALPPPAKEGDPAPKCFYNEADNPWAWCLGMGKGPGDDEPSERCKACWYLEAAHQEAEAAVEKED